MTYLPLGSMTVKAGLSGAVTPALAMVNVEVELEVDHFSVELNESVRVIIHVTGESKREVLAGRREEWSGVVGDGMGRKWRR